MGLFNRKPRKFRGKSYDDLMTAIDRLYFLMEDVALTETEQSAIRTGMACINQIMNRMVDDRKIEWDE